MLVQRVHHAIWVGHFHWPLRAFKAMPRRTRLLRQSYGPRGSCNDSAFLMEGSSKKSVGPEPGSGPTLLQTAECTRKESNLQPTD